MTALSSWALIALIALTTALFIAESNGWMDR